MQRTYPEILGYVEVGAQALDIEVPEWFTRTDRERLDLESCISCVLGQVYRRNYHDAPQTVRTLQPWQRGFSLDVTDGVAPTKAHWQFLTDAWRTQVEKRLADAGLLLA